jgi:hypothetical protein
MHMPNDVVDTTCCTAVGVVGAPDAQAPKLKAAAKQPAIQNEIRDVMSFCSS